MKLWKALIIDDELLARQELIRLLRDHREIDVRGEADSVPSAMEAIEAFSPDLIFLDIDLGDQTGFDLLERVGMDFQVIFVTAFDEYAIRAFRVNALDYLLKPVHPERLRESLERLGSTFRPASDFQLKPYDKILVSHQNSSRLITVSSISFIEAFGDYTKIHTRDGYTGTLHHTIKRWTQRLPESMFIQCHRSFIVNADRIYRLIKKNKSSFEIELDHPAETIPLSRQYNGKISRQFRVD